MFYILLLINYLYFKDDFFWQIEDFRKEKYFAYSNIVINKLVSFVTGDYMKGVSFLIHLSLLTKNLNTFIMNYL